MGEGELLSAFVFTGYGPFYNPNPALKKHLDEGILACNMERPEVIVLTGGYSARKTMPNISEAGSMFDYMMPLLKYQPTIIMDRAALTTLDNVRNTASLLRNRGLEPAKMFVTFWCDPTRKRTIEVIGKPLFGVIRVRAGKTKVVTDPAWKNFAAFAITVTSSKCDFINNRFRAMREKQFANS